LFIEPLRHAQISPSRPEICALNSGLQQAHLSGCQSRHPRLPLSRGSEPVPALDWKRHGVKIPPVGVEVLQVDE
jgi:hypothetical protein